MIRFGFWYFWQVCKFLELAEKIQNMDSSKLPQFDDHTCLADQPEAEAPWQENLTTFEDPLQSKPVWGKKSIFRCQSMLFDQI